MIAHRKIGDIVISFVQLTRWLHWIQSENPEESVSDKRFTLTNK